MRKILVYNMIDDSEKFFPFNSKGIIDANNYYETQIENTRYNSLYYKCEPHQLVGTKRIVMYIMKFGFFRRKKVKELMQLRCSFFRLKNHDNKNSI